jgi:hypothetical protein
MEAGLGNTQSDMLAQQQQYQSAAAGVRAVEAGSAFEATHVNLKTRMQPADGYALAIKRSDQQAVGSV